MLCVVLLYSDKIKCIFRSWQRRSAVCFGVASAKGKKTTIYYCIVFITFSFKLSMGEIEWTFSDLSRRWTLSWKPACCRFLERGSLIEIFWQLWLQWKKILAQNCQSPLPQTMINFLTLLFFMSDSFSEEGCHIVTSKSNSDEIVRSCNHLTHLPS